MIDEKKIEEAADAYLLEKLKDNVIGDSDFKDVPNAFKSGINWFKENLWHDASEEPVVGKEYLLKAVFQNYDGEIFEGYVTSTFGVDGWKEDFFPRSYDIEVKKWACIEDLMKGGE